MNTYEERPKRVSAVLWDGSEDSENYILEMAEKQWGEMTFPEVRELLRLDNGDYVVAKHDSPLVKMTPSEFEDTYTPAS